MSSQKDHLVACAGRRFRIQSVHFVLETLPLGHCRYMTLPKLEGAVCIVGYPYKAEICGSLRGWNQRPLKQKQQHFLHSRMWLDPSLDHLA